MGVLSNQSSELVRLGSLGNRDTTCIKIRLEPTVGPRIDRLVERLLSSETCIVRSLGILVTGLASSSTKGARSRVAQGIIEELGSVSADESAKLVGLSTLGN